MIEKYVLISKIDNWEGRQVYVSGFSTNDRNNGQLQGAYLKIDPFSYCVNTHDKGKFTGDDDASRTFRFILEKSLPRKVPVLSITNLPNTSIPPDSFTHSLNQEDNLDLNPF